jgi:hypothetical protein
MRDQKTSSGGFCAKNARPVGRLEGGHTERMVFRNTGLRLTAGWAQQPASEALYGSTPPTDVLGETLQSRPPEGAVGRGPAAQERLVPGKVRKGKANVITPTQIARSDQDRPCSGPEFAVSMRQ